MSESITFPVQLWLNHNSNRNVVWATVFAIFYFIVAPLLFTWWPSRIGTAPIQSLLVGGLFVSFFIFIFLFPRPAEIQIDQTSLTVKPIPFFGFAPRSSVTYNIKEFECVGLNILRLPRGRPIYRIIFMDQNWKKIRCDLPKSTYQPSILGGEVPSETKMRNYVNELGAALNLKVKENV